LGYEVLLEFIHACVCAFTPHFLIQTNSYTHQFYTTIIHLFEFVDKMHSRLNLKYIIWTCNYSDLESNLPSRGDAWILYLPNEFYGYI